MSMISKDNNQRILSGFLAALLLFSMLPQITLAQSFSDVLDNNRNATAIEYLKTRGVISGYPDGSFQPDKAVSRVEFLKLALLASNISLDVGTPANFTDTDNNAWYAPYLRKAKKEGWVQGYADGSFKPTQSVNKVEGLKIIAKIQGWTLPTNFEASFTDTPNNQWYSGIVAYAKTHNFLEETGSFFIPSASLSRAKTSETLFRAMITAQTNSTAFSTELIAQVPFTPAPTPSPTPTPVPTPEQPANFTPVTYQTFNKNYFSNITLSDSFPNTFYLNEVYNFEGTINGGSYSSIFAFVQSTSHDDFTVDVTNGSFSIPVVFRKAGNYKLGIIPGTGGSSKYVEISVLPNLPTAGLTGSSTTPTNLQAHYSNQKTTFSWENNNDSLSRITFTQGGNSKSFFSRQNIKEFDASPIDFKTFSPGNMSYRVESAQTSHTNPLQIDTPWTSSGTQTFNATYHTFSETHPDQITYSSLPETLASSGTGNISFSGKNLSDIFKEAEVIRPDGKVDSFDLQTTSTLGAVEGNPVIKSGGNYSFNYNTTSNGTYIIEINGSNGLAVLNTPVYVGDNLPLIPDFFDLEDATPSPSDNSISTDILTTNLLNLTNQDRNKYGSASVRIDTQLNQLAQNHANDMLNRNFFGHINPTGQSPDDRRKIAGISTPVGENIARTPTLLYAHNGLMRSAIHRNNILDPQWTRVGIGIAKVGSGDLLVVEEFSTDPLDAASLSTIKSGLYSDINQQRTNNGISTLSTNPSMESVSENWSKEMADQNFFAFVAPNGDSVSSNVQKAFPGKSVQIYILEASNKSLLSGEIFSSTQATSATWKTIGIGLQVDSNGTLKLTILLSN